MRRTILTLSILAFVLSGQAQTIKPYLQAAKPNSIWINWKTNNGFNPSVVFGNSPGSLDNTAIGNTINLEPEDPGYNTPYHYHSVQLTDLTPNTGYYYRALSGSADQSDIHYFRTPPALGTDEGKLRFIFLGDHQIINYQGQPYMKYNELVQAAKAKAEELYGTPIADNINLIVNDGDQVDLGRLLDYEKIHFEKSSYLTPNLPIITAVGNHETYGAMGIESYYDHFVLDDEWHYNNIYSGTERYYAYQLGNALFVVLDTELNGNTQLDWLQNVISEAANDPGVGWIISIAHRPYQAEQYSNDYSPWFANNAKSVLTQTDKYILHIGGHHHLYSRGQYKDHNGYHIISGGTAWPQYWGDSSNEVDLDETQGSWSNFAFQIMEIDNDAQSMQVKSYTIGSLYTDKDNELLDEFHYFKNQPVPDQPTLSGPPLTEPLNLPITFSSSDYSSSGTELLNSTHFQVSNASDFSVISTESFRHKENWYGPLNGSITDETQNIGLGDGILEYTINNFGLNNGTHFIRVRHRDENLGWSPWSEALEFEVTGSIDGETVLVLDKPYFETNEPINITYLNGNGHPQSWIGIYNQGDVPGAIPSTTWNYVGGNVSGIQSFSLAQSGIYFAAFFEDDDYEEMAERVSFWVGATPELSTDQPIYQNTSPVTISYTNGPNNVNDWIGIYKAGTNIAEENLIAMQPIDVDANLNVFENLEEGFYFAAYHVQDSYINAGEPVYFQYGDTPTKVETNKTTYAIGEPIFITFEDGPGIEKDYIGVYEQGTPAGSNLWTYKYFGGLASGTTVIDGLDGNSGAPNQLPDTIGAYYLAMYTNDSYTQVSNIVEFNIDTITSVFLDQYIINVNESFEVYYAGAPGNALDWLGIYVDGDEPGSQTSYTYEYIDGNTSGSQSFSIADGGHYYVNIFENDGYEELADRVFFDVRGIPILTVQSVINTPGQPVFIDLQNGLPDVLDWIGIYPQGATPNDLNLIASAYVENSSDGTYEFADLPEGVYFATYHTEDSFEEVGERVNFQVGNQYIEIDTDQNRYWLEQPVILTYENAYGITDEIVAIYEEGATPFVDDYVTFLNVVPGQSNANVTLDGLIGNPGDENVLPQTPGLYYGLVIDTQAEQEVSNPTFFQIAIRPTVELLDPPAIINENFTIAYYNNVGNTLDWLGVYKDGDIPGSVGSTTWEYVGTQTGDLINGELDFTLDQTGLYFALLLENDGYNELSERLYFEVFETDTTMVNVRPIPGEKAIELFPNPTESNSTLISQSNIQQVLIYEISGSLVKEIEIPSEKRITLNLKGLPKGSYLVEVRTEDGIYREQLLLE